MTTFPDYKPIYQPAKSTNRSGSSVNFGDGYTSNILFGLNSASVEWRLQWIVDEEAANEIDSFLQTQADNGDHFEWQPPDLAALVTWKCEEWVVENQGPDIFSITATFVRVSELSYLQLAPDIATCEDDVLCTTDTGNWGQWPAWVAKLRGSVAPSSTNAGCSTCYTFDNGYIYLAYTRPTAVVGNFDLYLAKFRSDGVVEWVRKYGGFSAGSMAGSDDYFGFQMTADESNNLLFLTWEKRNASTSNQSGANTLICINAFDGTELWESGYTLFAFWAGNCTYKQADNTPYGLVNLVYDKINDEIVINGVQTFGSGQLGSVAVFNKNGEPVRENRASPATRRHESGYLGNSQCKVIVNATVNSQIYFLTSSADSSAGGYGYRTYAPLGTSDLCGNLLGNGQACVATTAGAGWDLIIFEDNGTVVDHVKFTGRGFITANTRWPYDPLNLGVLLRAGYNVYVSLRRDPDNQYRLYFQATSARGINFAVVEVTVNPSNKKITSIGNYSSYVATSHDPSDPSNSNKNYYATGANKFIANTARSYQITATPLQYRGLGFAGAQLGQVALVSFKRFGGINSTGGVWDLFYIGDQTSQILGSNYYYYVDSSPVAPTRTGLTATVIYDQLNIAPGILYTNSPCPGPVFLGVKIRNSYEMTTEDVTSSQIFDLYTM